MPLPYNEILIALKEDLEAAVGGALVGYPPKPLTVRHGRHRDARDEQWPCVSIRFISSDPSQEAQQTTAGGMPEEVMELAVNIVIDMDLPPEADDDAPLDEDPTGWGSHAAVMGLILDHLLPGQEAPENTLDGRVWVIRYDGTAPDEGDASPDCARLEERLVLVYRVRADRPTILLRGT